MIDPLPPTLPVEPTALFRTAMVVVGGLIAWVAWVFLKTPVRPRALFPEPPEPPAEEPEAEEKSEEPKDEAKEEPKAEEPKEEPKAEEKSEEPKAEAKEEPKPEAADAKKDD